MHRIVLVSLLLLSLCGGQLTAAAVDWAPVQAIAPGQRIEVALLSGQKLTGDLDHATAEAVFIRNRSGVAETRRQDIQRLYLIQSRSGAKSAAIGAAIGAGGGGALGGAIMERETGYGGAVAGTVALGALIGAGVGYALKGSPKRVLVYEVSR